MKEVPVFTSNNNERSTYFHITRVTLNHQSLPVLEVVSVARGYDFAMYHHWSRARSVRLL